MRLTLFVAAVIATAVNGCAAKPRAIVVPLRSEVAAPAAPVTDSGYLIQAGDTLQVTVWKEQDLTSEVLVRSDGGLSFPLIGDIMAAGRTVEALRLEFTKRLKNYIPDPVVSIATKQMGGNQIYVIGRVQRPGGFPFVKPLDVMEALSLAGGGTPFASLNSIVILRRENGRQRTIPFRYSDIAHGRHLSQNIMLESGDTVVVP